MPFTSMGLASQLAEDASPVHTNYPCCQMVWGDLVLFTIWRRAFILKIQVYFTRNKAKPYCIPAGLLGSGHLRHWVTWGRLHIIRRLWVKPPSPMGVTAFWQTPGPKMLLWNITLSGSGNKPSIHFQHLFSK